METLNAGVRVDTKGEREDDAVDSQIHICTVHTQVYIHYI